MLVLKLRPVGKKHQRSFWLVAQEKREKLNGKSLENLGWYNPRDKKYNINKERALHWLKNGAQKTASVHNLLVNAGIIEGPKIPVHKKSKVEKPAATEAPKKPASAELTPKA